MISPTPPSGVRPACQRPIWSCWCVPVGRARRRGPGAPPGGRGRPRPGRPGARPMTAHRTGGLAVTLCRDFREFGALAGEWDALHRRCATPTPFQSHAWLHSWWISYGQGGAAAGTAGPPGRAADRGGAPDAGAPSDAAARPDGRGRLRLLRHPPGPGGGRVRGGGAGARSGPGGPAHRGGPAGGPSGRFGAVAVRAVAGGPEAGLTDSTCTGTAGGAAGGGQCGSADGIARPALAALQAAQGRRPGRRDATGLPQDGSAWRRSARCCGCTSGSGRAGRSTPSVCGRGSRTI
ncbi:hypothetical protein SBADM41S_09443 [Streptomyces badius]